MNTRLFDPVNDYPVLCSWWARRGLPAIPLELIPSHGAVCEAGIPIAMGFCYFDTGGKIGVVDFISTNPAVAASSTTLEAISNIFVLFHAISEKRGCRNLMSWVAKDTGLHRLMVKAGWQDPHSAPHIMLFKSWPSPV